MPISIDFDANALAGATANNTMSAARQRIARMLARIVHETAAAPVGGAAELSA